MQMQQTFKPFTLKSKKLVKHALSLFVLMCFGIQAQAISNFQIIHNAADPALEVVDVYLENDPTPAYSNIPFRSATEFNTMPSGTYTVSVSPQGTSLADSVAKFEITLEADSNYSLIVSGVDDPTNFDQSVNDIEFDLYANDKTRLQAENTGEVDFQVFHGVTDLGGVDIYERNLGMLINGLAYGNYSNYSSVSPDEYIIDVHLQGDSDPFASYEANLNALADASVTIFASGFLDPANNNNGEDFGLFAAFSDGNVIQLDEHEEITANAQIIHNAADPNADEVDVYKDDELIIRNFNFRDATEYLELPADETFLLGIAPAGSLGAGDTIAAFEFELVENEYFTILANGVLDPSQFDDSVNDIAFDLYPADQARTEADDASEVDLRAFHGISDLGDVDIFERNTGLLIEELAYGNFSNFLALAPDNYIIDIHAHSNAEPLLSFDADLTAFEGEAITFFASGFADPANNQSGEEAGLFVALTDGTVIQLPEVEDEPKITANAQIIHNAADPDAEMVDIYKNDSLILSDFAFRSATGFVELPADEIFYIGIAPAGSQDAGDTIAAFEFELEEDEYYTIFANGVLDPSQFDDSVNDIAFDLYPADQARTEADDASELDLRAFHGISDLGDVDIFERNTGLIIEELAYGNFSNFLSLAPENYIIDIHAHGEVEPLLSFNADLNPFEGEAITVFASGFADPANNQSGEKAGLFVALTDGTVIEIPERFDDVANVQIIHNAADPAASSVDVYAGAELLLEDFSFREATEYLHFPSDSLITIGIAPAGSESAEDTIAAFNYILIDQEYYTLIANGVLDPDDFSTNVNEEIGFDLYLNEQARAQASEFSEVNFNIFHGVTDIPNVDIYERDMGELISDLSYGEYSDYLEVAPGEYLIDIYTAGGSHAELTYTANLLDYEGQAGVIFASGFNIPEQNQNGESVGLFLALSDGTVIELPEGDQTNLESTPASPVSEEKIYPNPAQNEAMVEFSLNHGQSVSINVYDYKGSLLKTIEKGSLSPGKHSTAVDVSDLNEGTYIVNINSGSYSTSQKLLIVK